MRSRLCAGVRSPYANLAYQVATCLAVKSTRIIALFAISPKRRGFWVFGESALFPHYSAERRIVRCGERSDEEGVERPLLPSERIERGKVRHRHPA
jgi:hypothetical protein